MIYVMNSKLHLYALMPMIKYKLNEIKIVIINDYEHNLRSNNRDNNEH